MSTNNTGNNTNNTNNTAGNAVLSLSDMLQNIANANAAAGLDTPRSDVSSVTSQHTIDFAQPTQPVQSVSSLSPRFVPATPTANLAANTVVRNPWRCSICGAENGANFLDCASCLRPRSESNLRLGQSITDILGRDISAVERNINDDLASAVASGVLPASRSRFSLANSMLPTNQVTSVSQFSPANPQVMPVSQQVTTEVTRPTGSTAVFTPSVSPVIQPAVAPVTPTYLTMSATSSMQTPLVRGTPVMNMPGMPGMTSTPIMTRPVLLAQANRTTPVTPVPQVDPNYNIRFQQAKQRGIQIQQQNAFLAQHQQATQQPQNQQATQQPQNQQATQQPQNQQATVLLPNLTPVALGTQSVGSATSMQPAGATTTFKQPTFQTTNTQSATITSVVSQPATMDVNQVQPVVISTTNTQTPGISTTVTQNSSVPVNTTVPATIDTTTTRNGILATTATHTMVPSLNISQATSLSPRSATGTLYVDSQSPTPTGAGLYGIQGSLTAVSGALLPSNVEYYVQVLDENTLLKHEGRVVSHPKIPYIGEIVAIREGPSFTEVKRGRILKFISPINQQSTAQPTAQVQPLQQQPTAQPVQVQYSQPAVQPAVQVQHSQPAVQPVQVQPTQPTIQYSQPAVQVQPVQVQPTQYQIPNTVAPLPVTAPVTTASATTIAPNTAPVSVPINTPATMTAPIMAPVSVPITAPLQSATAIIPTGAPTINTTVSAAGNTFAVPAGAMNMPTLVGTGASVPVSQLVTILTSNGTVVSGALLPNQALSTSTPPPSIPQTHIDSFNKIVLYVNQTLSATIHQHYTSRTDVFNNTPYRIATYKDGSRVINGEVIVPPNIQDDIGKLMVSARNKLSMLVSLWHYNADYMVGTLLVESPWKLCQYLESQGTVITANQSVNENDLITRFLNKKGVQLYVIDHSMPAYARQLGGSTGKVLDAHLSDKKPGYYMSGSEFPDSIAADLHLFYPSAY